ncbi:MAG: OmpA family protein [Rhodospirillaceae bacterium]|nr:OmpA family protein [Rhodospirillaceae bacterium]
MAETAKTPFNYNLYDGYIGLSKMEYKEGDYEDSDRFAMRAMKASTAKKDTAVKPEGFKARNLPADKADDLRKARGRLMIALHQGGRENYPRFAADAQVKFDCWMQEQEENFQPKDIEACKKGFMKAIAKLEKAVAPKPVAKKMMKKKMPMMAAKPRAPEPVDVDGIYIVFFDLNSSKLNPASQRILRKAAAEFALTDSPGMNLNGHTDKAGPAGYNYDLSQRRLNAVRGYLMKMGVTQPSLLSSAYGEEKPLVPTRDGKKEKRNRRVEIIFQ